MQEKTTIDWKTDEQFRENAKRFYQKCKDELRMPYSEVVFVETACAIFESVRKKNKANMVMIEELAIKAIKNIYPDMRKRNIKKEVIELLRGEAIGDAPDGRWFDFCCEFRCRIMKRYSLRNEYCRKIAEKERKIIEYHVPSNIQKDLIHLAITIELL